MRTSPPSIGPTIAPTLTRFRLSVWCVPEPDELDPEPDELDPEPDELDPDDPDDPDDPEPNPEDEVIPP